MTLDEQMQLKIAEARAFQAAKLIELTGMVQEHEQKIQSINAAASRWRTFSPAEVLEAMAENKEREENAAESERFALRMKRDEAENAASTLRTAPIDRFMWATFGFALGAMTSGDEP